MDYTMIPLSGFEMMQLNPDATLIKYTDLYNVNDIDQAFRGKNKLIILYLIQSDRSGHWTCLMKRPYGYEFFDSYGLDIDDELNFISERKRDDLDEEYKILSEMLKPYKVVYNNVKLQGKDTQTCGDHVTCRLHNSDVSLHNYIDFFIKNKINNPDQYVAKYTFNLLKNIQ